MTKTCLIFKGLFTITIVFLSFSSIGCGGGEGNTENSGPAPGPEESALYGMNETVGVFDVDASDTIITPAPDRFNQGPVSSSPIVGLSGTSSWSNSTLTLNITITNQSSFDLKGVVMRIVSLASSVSLTNSDGYNFYNYGDIAVGQSVSRDVIVEVGYGLRFRTYITQKRPPVTTGVIEAGLGNLSKSSSPLPIAMHRSNGSPASPLGGEGWRVSYLQWFRSIATRFATAISSAVAATPITGTITQGARTSLKLDANGNPKASYLQVDSYDLKYTYWDGSQWQIVTVDSAGKTGYFASLALTSLGNPRISYYSSEDSSNNPTGNLRYAYCNTSCNDPTNWGIVTVDSTGDVGGHTSIVLNSSGNPRISYYDFTNGDLKYAYCDVNCYISTNWTKVAVDSTGNVGEYTSIALDSSGNPRISYYDYLNGDLKYAYCDSGCNNPSNWIKITVDSTMDVGGYTSIALDSSGKPRISYYDFENLDLKYAYCDSGCNNPSNWFIVTVDGGPFGTYGNYYPDMGGFSSLALDVSGNPAITYYYYWYIDILGRDPLYYNFFIGDLRYAFCLSSCGDPANWKKGTIDSLNDTGWFTSTIISNSNYLYVTYYDATTRDLKIMAFKHPSPFSDIIDMGAYTGYYNSIKTDLNDYPHISYALYYPNNMNATRIKYAYWDGSQWGDLTTFYIDFNPTDTVSVWEPQTSLALTSTGKPRILYVWDKRYLKYAYCDSGCSNTSGWTKVTLGDISSTNQSFIGPSLTLDSSGNPRISYWEVDVSNINNSTIKYAYCDTNCGQATSWTTVSVDTVGNYNNWILRYKSRDRFLDGRQPSLSLNTSNNPRIAYYDANNQDLKYAYCDSGCSNPSNWIKTTIVSAGDVGRFASLALNSSGNPRVTYWGDSLMFDFAYCDANCGNSNNWTIVRQVSYDANICEGFPIGQVYWNNSLVLNASGLPGMNFVSGGDDGGNEQCTYLYYTFCSSGCDSSANWTKTGLDSADIMGWTSLTLDSIGNRHTSYHNNRGGTNMGLNYRRDLP